MTALRKPGGGVRAIAAPSLLQRLAGPGLVRARKAELEAALGHHKFAVGTAVGAELMAHTARALIEAEPDLVLVALDARNAFCCADRKACLPPRSRTLLISETVLEGGTDPSLKFFEGLYASSSQIGVSLSISL